MVEKPIDIVGLIIELESGTLDLRGTLTLFGELIKTGQAWSLQGSYGRGAASLIESGIFTKKGILTQKGRDLLSREEGDYDNSEG